MVQHLRTVQWVGGPQDGALVTIPGDATWVTVLEDRRNPGYVPTEDNDKPPRSLQRYTVPVIDGRIVWAQRVLAEHVEEP